MTELCTSGDEIFAALYQTESRADQRTENMPLENSRFYRIVFPRARSRPRPRERSRGAVDIHRGDVYVRCAILLGFHAALIATFLFEPSKKEKESLLKEDI